MPRGILLVAALVALFCPRGWLSAGELIDETTANRHGLSRPWFTQVMLDRSRGRLTDLILYDGTLYAQTDRAVIHAIDAETGKTLWWKQVGQPRQISMTPDAKGKLLATINGSQLYVLNRVTGEILLEKETPHAPGAGPALSTQRTYVPMLTGVIAAYRLEPATDALTDADAPEKEPDATEGSDAAAPPDAERAGTFRLREDVPPPLLCQSHGKALVQPRVTRENVEEECVVWPTDRGYLNLAKLNRHARGQLELTYRLEAGAPIAARPAYVPPDPKAADGSGLIVAAARNGLVFAVEEKKGDLAWQFVAGDPIVQPPTAIDDRIYVCTQFGGMYCLAAQDGREALWFAPNVLQFVAAGKDRVYGVDRLGRLIVLNAKNGVRLDVLSTERIPIKFVNTDTDRIYLADETGLVQCLRELEQTEPLVHGKERKRAAAEAENAPARAPSKQAAKNADQPQGADADE